MSENNGGSFFDKLLGKKPNASRNGISKSIVPDGAAPWANSDAQADPAREAKIQSIKVEEERARNESPDKNLTPAEFRAKDADRSAKMAAENPLAPAYYPADMDAKGIKTQEAVTEFPRFVASEAANQPQVPAADSTPASAPVSPDLASAGGSEVREPAPLDVGTIEAVLPGVVPVEPSVPPEFMPIPTAENMPVSTPEPPIAEAEQPNVVKSEVAEAVVAPEAPLAVPPQSVEQVQNDQSNGEEPMTAAEAQPQDLAAVLAENDRLRKELAAAQAKAASAKVTMPDLKGFGAEVGAAFGRYSERQAERMNDTSFLGEFMKRAQAGLRRLKETTVKYSAPVLAAVDMARDAQIRDAAIRVIEGTGQYIKIKGASEIDAVATDLSEGTKGHTWAIVGRALDKVDDALSEKAANGSVLAQALEVAVGHGAKEAKLRARSHFNAAEQKRSLLDSIVDGMKKRSDMNTTPADVQASVDRPTTYEAISPLARIKTDIAALVKEYRKIPDKQWAEKAEELFDLQPENLRSAFYREIARHGALMERALFSADRILLSYDYMRYDQAIRSGTAAEQDAAYDALVGHMTEYRAKLERIQDNKGMMAVAEIQYTAQATLARFNNDYEDMEAPWILPR